jgi:SAM-dependent methyltransferase
MSLSQFAREYRAVRRAEGWGSSDGAYYRALPFRDLTGRYAGIWRMRARAYATLIQQVLEPLEQHASALQVLDLGAGSGWLAHRLASRGHYVTAIDLQDDPLDGVGALRHYSRGSPHKARALLAEFDRLPLPPNVADLVIFNASLHYSTNYAVTIKESLRVLRARGTLVILDSPMYVDPTSGARMVEERRARFLAQYGFASDALPSEHFLSPARLEALASELDLAWQVYRPELDWRSELGRRVGGFRARREPAHFPVIVGRRP